MLVLRMRDTRFMRWAGCRHEQNPIQTKPLRGLAGQRQMSFVDRVEGAAENSQPQEAYALSIFTELMRTSFEGRSWEFRGTREIFFTTS